MTALQIKLIELDLVCENIKRLNELITVTDQPELSVSYVEEFSEAVDSLKKISGDTYQLLLEELEELNQSGEPIPINYLRLKQNLEQLDQ